MNDIKDPWFDDPEWEDLRQRINNRPSKKQSAKIPPTSAPVAPKPQPVEPIVVVSPTQAVAPKKVHLSIDLSLPKIKRPKLNLKAKAQRLLKRHGKRTVVGASVVVLLIVGMIGFNIFAKPNSAGSGTSSADNPEGVLAEQTEEPKFKAVLPNGSSELTDSKKTAYDPSKGVVSFTDSIDGITITASEQQLPDEFLSDADNKLADMATQLYAKDVIQAGATKAYLGNNIKGPQTVILHKQNLLIFLHSDTKIANEKWAEYIKNLE